MIRNESDIVFGTKKLVKQLFDEKQKDKLLNDVIFKYFKLHKNKVTYLFILLNVAPRANFVHKKLQGK